MNIHFKDFSEINYLSNRDKAYQACDPSLRPFYKYEVDLESFEKVIQAKKNHYINREQLVHVIKDQYSSLSPNELQIENIKTLNEEKTFTIVTAHQPSLLTGPLYYIYKIASTIHLCKNLKTRFPEYNFVPLFINGSEDHDFDEIDHVHLFNQRIQWKEEKRGPVGRLPIDQLPKVLEEVSKILGSSVYAENVRSVLENALSKSEIYNDFTSQLVQALFGQYGLISINMDDHRLKSLFVPLIKREIFERFSKSHIEQTQSKLEAAGFKSQAFPRAINFFYLGDGYRERIELEDGKYHVLNKKITFTKAELEREIELYPERFSPNVNMRPLYQESILPNLAYIGGGGELAYWMERMSQFDDAGVPFPMLIRRNSVLLINKGNQKLIDKLDLGLNDIWNPEHELITAHLHKNSDVEIQVSEEYEDIQKAFEAIAERANIIDPGLEKYIQAEKTKALKNIDQIGSRLKRAVKSKEEIKVKQIGNLKNKLFPSGGLQERHDNFFQYYITYGRTLLDNLIENLNPLDKRFIIIELE